VTNQTTQNASQEIVPSDADESEYDLLAPYWKQVKEKLFPLLQEETGLELTHTLKTLVQVLEIIRIEELVSKPKRGKRGGQEIDRRPLARAFVAKAFFNLSQTRALKEQLDRCPALRKLCGMEKAPSEATFSRAFSQFAQMGLGQLAHAAMIEKFVTPQLVMHISHDSTAIEAREKATRKVKPPRVKKNGAVPKKEKSALILSRLE
jgi:transposase